MGHTNIRSQKAESAPSKRRKDPSTTDSKRVPRRRIATGGCNIVAVGKRRDGGTRYWCLLHKADATAKYGRPAPECRASHIPLIAPADLFVLNLNRYKGGVALWGAVPPVYDTSTLAMERGIHIHARITPGAVKEMDYSFSAVRIVGNRLSEEGIVVSELEAIYYMVASVFGYEMKHIACTYCGYSHLDRDWFSVHPHRRHLCAGCGRHFRDAATAIGNPICGIREACGVKTRPPKLSKRKLGIRQADFPGGIQIWGSNPAFLWTSELAEEEGIHVHAFVESGDSPSIDETYSEVTIDGMTLDPTMVRVLMAQSALPSLKSRILPVNCPSCHEPQFGVGERAFTPIATHTCSGCGLQFSAPGRLRNVIANPLPGILLSLAERAPRAPQQHDLGLLPETL